MLPLDFMSSYTYGSLSKRDGSGEYKGLVREAGFEIVETESLHYILTK